MSFFKNTFPKILKTSLIVSLAIYIPLALILSIVGIDDPKKKEIVPKQEILEAALKIQK